MLQKKAHVFSTSGKPRDGTVLYGFFAFTGLRLSTASPCLRSAPPSRHSCWQAGRIHMQTNEGVLDPRAPAGSASSHHLSMMTNDPGYRKAPALRQLQQLRRLPLHVLLVIAFPIKRRRITSKPWISCKSSNLA